MKKRGHILEFMSIRTYGYPPSHRIALEDLWVSPSHRIALEDLWVSPSHRIALEDLWVSPDNSL
jgi:hypothetical protein